MKFEPFLHSLMKGDKAVKIIKSLGYLMLLIK